MSSVKKCILFNLIIVSVFIGICMFWWHDPGNQAQQGSKIRVAAVFPYSKGYWKEIQDGLLSENERANMDIRFFFPDTDYSVKEMTELVRQASATQADVLIVQGANDQEYQKVLKEAAAAGTVIGLIDTDIPDFQEKIYVGTDNYEAGQLIAHRLTEYRDGQANVIVLMGGREFANLNDRLQGFLDGVRENSGIQIVSVEETNYDMVTVINKGYLMENTADADTIVCLDGTGGTALGTSLGKKIFSSVDAFCFDMTASIEKAIREDVIVGTVAQKPVEMGKQMIREMEQYFQGKTQLPVNVYTDICFVTKENLEDILNEDQKA